MEKTFKTQLAEYKKLIDEDIEVYCSHVLASTEKTYGHQALRPAQAYTQILKRAGKRLRGALTLVGYEMCGGKDLALALQGARAIEMAHAYILIIDDVQDRSSLRRGGPSAHKLIENEHNKQAWKGSAEHTGVSLALNAALLGCHGAQLTLSNLDVDHELRIKALNILNHTMMVTVHGQSHDIINQLRDRVTEADIEKVLQWKTAHYTVLNPIHMGMVLAGAGCEDTNAITEFALNLGKAFQIKDDLLVLGSAQDKDAIDDVLEGKQTLLTAYAFEHASKNDTEFLQTCLGNRDLSQADFKRCQQILRGCGAEKHALKLADDYKLSALTSLKTHSELWPQKYVSFLQELAENL